MSHEGPGGGNGVDQTRFDHIADDEIHFPYGHGATDGKKPKTLSIAHHKVKRLCSLRNL